LFRAAKQYKSFKLESLSEMFELTPAEVTKQSAQLIMQNKLQMSIDSVNGLLLVNQSGTDIRELQQLSLQYVSQISTMVQQNENMANFLSSIDPSQSKKQT
jgi:hypothetical protein